MCLLVYASWFERLGWEVRLDEGMNHQGTGHMKNSLHYLGLAQDINFFIKGKYITTDCPEYQDLGRLWKSLHPLARWGGDFKSKDLNHFSVEHEGRA